MSRGKLPQGCRVADEPGARSLFIWRRLVPVLIVAVTVMVAGLILLQEEEDGVELQASVLGENRVRMQSSIQHVEEYFDSVYSTLLFISLDDDIIAMRKDSQAYVQKVYEHQWEQHQLVEVYVIKRDFTGQGPPFMAFEREADGRPVAVIHSPEREKDEYEVQIQQMERYSTNRSLQVQLSQEVLLCVPGWQSDRARGFVCSVPIYSGESLVGLVAGMVRTRTISELLRKGLNHQAALLVSDQGKMVLPENFDPAVARWLRQLFDVQGVSAFFGRAGASFELGGWVALWSPVKVAGGQKWWLVYTYPQTDYRPKTLLTGWVGHLLISGSLLGLGLALGLLVRSLGVRLDEQVRHLWDRRRMEREVQEVSEREQRRIGENLQEDLCQRLTGIEAASRVLERRLGASRPGEASVAAEIAREVKEAVNSARRMADELQPVTLLEHGLVAALEELAAHTRQRGGIACRLEDRGFPERIDAFTATHVYRIAQEALHNALRHAHAQTIVITLGRDGQDLTFAIRDDGVGIPEVALQRPGMGLRIMRYRADLIGARLDVGPAKTHQGTLISARFRNTGAGIKDEQNLDAGS